MMSRRDFLKCAGLSAFVPFCKPKQTEVVRQVGLPALDDFYDMSIDVLEIVGGVYHPPRYNISMDRSARPLTVRPAEGARVVWVGGVNNGLYFGWTPNISTAGYTFDGSPGQWIFTDYRIGQTGIIYMTRSRGMKFKNLDFAGNVGLNPVNSNSHTFYIANDNQDIEIAHCRIDGAGTLTGCQIYHDPLPDSVDFHHNIMTRCLDGCIWWGQSDEIPQTDIQARDNVFIDCVNSLDTNKVNGVARRNWALRSPKNIRSPFVDDGTNEWS